VTSQRKLKKQAEALGMTATEFQLVEMIEEVLDSMRWMQILAYTNQYLLNQKLKVTKEERDRILEAATRAVDKDQKIHEWQDRIDQLKGEITNIKRKVNRARRDIAQGKPAPAPPAHVADPGRDTGTDAAVDPEGDIPADPPTTTAANPPMVASPGHEPPAVPPGDEELSADAG
jgi:hypothetical protein